MRIQVVEQRQRPHCELGVVLPERDPDDRAARVEGSVADRRPRLSVGGEVTRQREAVVFESAEHHHGDELEPEQYEGESFHPRRQPGRTRVGSTAPSVVRRRARGSLPLGSHRVRRLEEGNGAAGSCGRGALADSWLLHPGDPILFSATEMHRRFVPLQDNSSIRDPAPRFHSACDPNSAWDAQIRPERDEPGWRDPGPRRVGRSELVAQGGGESLAPRVGRVGVTDRLAAGAGRRFDVQHHQRPPVIELGGRRWDRRHQPFSVRGGVQRTSVDDAGPHKPLERSALEPRPTSPDTLEGGEAIVDIGCLPDESPAAAPRFPAVTTPDRAWSHPSNKASEVERHANAVGRSAEINPNDASTRPDAGTGAMPAGVPHP